MIIAGQVKDSVNQKEENFFLCFTAGFSGLSPGGFGGNDHIPQNPVRKGGETVCSHGKGDDVGGTVAVKVLAVQPGNPEIVGDDDAEFITVITQQGQNFFGRSPDLAGIDGDPSLLVPDMDPGGQF